MLIPDGNLLREQKVNNNNITNKIDRIYYLQRSFII